MERKLLTVPTQFLSKPERSGIHSVIAPYIFISHECQENENTRKRMLSVSPHLLSDKRGDIQSVIAPYIYIRARMTEMEESLMDESQTLLCGTFTALRTSRPPPIPLRHISSYMTMSYQFSQELLRTAEAMMDYTKSSDMELFFIDALKNEIYRCPRSPRENRQLVRHKIGPGTTLAAYVAYTKTYVFVNDIINNENYPKGLNKKDSLAQRVMCIPVMTPSHELVAVLQLSRNVNMEPYSLLELELCLNTCQWIGITSERTHKNLGLRKKAAMYDYFHNLLNVYLFEDIPFRQYISELLSYTAKVMNAQCSVFYMVSDSGDMYGNADNVNYDMFMNLEKFFHFKKTSFGHETRTVASETRRQNKMLNLTKEELFMNYNLDIYKPVIVTSCLSATSNGYAASRGVAEMVNKQDNTRFGVEDEEIFSNVLLHADYVLSCHKLYEEISKLEACLASRNDTVQLHFEPCQHDKMEYENFEVEMDPDLYAIAYTPSNQSYLTLCKIIDMIFSDIIYRWKAIPIEDRARFLLMIHKASSSSEYLGFLKIFCSVHCVASIIIRCPDVFTMVEKELLMYSALCHQINVPVIEEHPVDHLNLFPGTASCDFSSSFYYTKLIFKNCKIFSDEEETEIMLRKMSKLMEACYHDRVGEKIGKIVMLLANKKFDLKKQRHRQLMRICVMVVAGFSMHFKPFSLSVEYHIQRALRSSKKFNQEQCDPSKKFQSMDRMGLAMSQRNFLDTVVLPWAIILRTILPPTTSMIFRLVEERENWNEITNSNICGDFWIPLKITPMSERNNDIIHFLESNSKESRGQYSSQVIGNKNPSEKQLARPEAGEDDDDATVLGESYINNGNTNANKILNANK